MALEADDALFRSYLGLYASAFIVSALINVTFYVYASNAAAMYDAGMTTEVHDGDAAEHDALAAAWQDLSVRYHQISCAVDRELQAHHQISGSEFEILELLWAADNHSRRMSDLSPKVHLSQSAMSRAVARLEKDGLVERSMCAADRRSVFAALTAAGVERFTQARPTQRRVLAELSTGCTQLLRVADGHVDS